MVNRVLVCCGIVTVASAIAIGRASEFEAPVMLKAGEKAVRVESPGWAAPCLTDFDGDGTKDLLVGQFADGKIHFHKGLGDLKFAPGTWLQADGGIATVPGVW